MITINWEKYMDFDANKMPPSMREIIFVSGTPYEMGYQYGVQTKEMIKRNFCLVAADALKAYTREQAEKRVEILSVDIKSKSPEISEWWRGIADGAGMSYWDIAMINMQLWLSIPYLMCSTIAAKDSATADGKLIAGVNGDITYNMSGYGVILVAHPDEGNAFVTLPQLAGQMGSNFAMNEKGLVVTFDGGESELPEDTSFGYADFISSMVYTVSKCDTAQEANEFWKNLGVAGGWIFLFADAKKDVMITEHTSSRDSTRYPGDHGEKDFVHAANHFVDDAMRVSSIKQEDNADSYIRYQTERKLLEDSLGELTLEKMMDIMGCTDAWDGEKWEKDIWGIIESNNSPEMRAPDFRTGTRCFGVPEDKTAYILHGTTDVFNSFMPGSMGKYCKIQLAASAEEVTVHMEEDAVLETWEAGHRLFAAEKVTPEQKQLLDQARRHIWTGKNYLTKARLTIDTDKNAARQLYSAAASEFAYAYIIAQTI